MSSPDEPDDGTAGAQPQTDFEGRLPGSALTQEVAAARLAQAADARALWPIVTPRIDAHLTACSLALDDLRSLHRALPDALTFDVAGDDRAAVAWQMAGRCIGLLEVLIVQVRGGIGELSIPTGRALHEATSLLVVLADPAEADLRQTWLQDEGRYGYVKPGQARASYDRFETRIDESKRRQGLPANPGTARQRAELYDRLSRAAHHRRSSLLNHINPVTRRINYGVEEDPVRASTAAAWVAGLTVEVLQTITIALGGMFDPPDYLQRRTEPLVEAINAMRREQPLNEAAIRNGLAG